MKAVILAGGKGTRLGNLTKEIPKPMIKIGDKPVLEHQIETLINNGINEIILIVGHLHEIILNYFGNGEKFNINIDYIIENEPLGTAGALYYLKNKVKDDFILLYGDVMFDINFERFIEYHKIKKSIATLYVHPNSHPYDSDLIILDRSNRVVEIEFKNNKRDYYYNNCVNAGVYIMNEEILNLVQKPEKLDLEKDLVSKLVNEKKEVYAYKGTEYIKDMGTLDRLEEVTKAYYSGIIKQKNLKNKQKCIFLDRDGTINKYKGLLSDINELELEDGVCEAIKKINSSEYLCIIITNQPVIARNLCTIEEVENIHRKLETLLGNNGVYIDDILYCPHHPDKGYPEENPKYKIKCNCRKPNTELIDICVDRYNIDRAKSFMIGDTTVDIKTGENAGLQTVLVLTGEAGSDHKYQVTPDLIVKNLSDAINFIIK